MRTVQLTLDEDLVAQVDKLAARLGTSRSALTRQALQKTLSEFRARMLERKHRAGYKRRPVTPDEFGNWEEEQAWGDE